MAAPIQSHPRKIIIENLPAPPPKPRDIILEKWLPCKDSSHLHATRPVYYQKSYKTMSQSQLITTTDANSNSNGITCSGSSINGGSHKHKQHQVYEIIEHQHRPIASHYEYVESSSNNSKKLYKQFTNSSNSTNSSGHNHHYYHKKHQHQQQQPAYTHQSESIHSSEMLYATPVTNSANNIYASPSHSMQQVFVSPDVYYTPSPSRKSKVAGYRIIRQIIPGPNSTPADIEKALARSQRISTVYPTPNVNTSGSGSTIQKQYHNKIYSPTFDMNASFQSPIYSGNSQQYEYFYSPKQIPIGNMSLSTNSKYLIGSPPLQPPHDSHAPRVVYNKTNVFRSTSIDNF